MNPIFFYEYGKSRGGIPNTFIGGVSATIGTAQLMADKLSNYPSGTTFLASDIYNFKIVGDDISFTISKNYELKQTSFSGNAQIKNYKDVGGFLKRIGTTSFSDALNFSDYNFNEVVSIGNGAFINTPKISFWFLPKCTKIENRGLRQSMFYKKYYLPLCVNLGDTVDLNDSAIFQSNYFDSVFYLNPNLQTANAGQPDQDIVIGVNAYYRYILNYTPPSPITNLSVESVFFNSIRLLFTPPASTNAIEYYEVYVNGVYKGDSFNLNYVIVSELVNSTLYTIKLKAVDIFYNKSDFSNVVTQTVNGVDLYPTINIINSFNLNKNPQSQRGNNHIRRLVGADYAIAKSQFGLSTVGVKCFFENTTDLNFTNGANDLPFSLVFLMKWNSFANHTILQKRIGSVIEYQFSIYSNIYYFDLYDSVNSAYIRASFSRNLMNTTDFFNITHTYNGSGLANGLKIYLNGSLVTTTQTTIGSYSRMRNNNAPLSLSGDLGNFNGTVDSICFFNKELSASESLNIQNTFQNGYKLL